MARKAKKTMKVKAKGTARKGAGRAAMKAATKPKAPAKLKVGEKPLKKSQIFAYVAETAELSKKQVSHVFDALSHVMEEHLKKTGPGEFILPGLLKARVQRKPATKARKGVNPFTGEEMMFKAKPARNVVRIRPLKKLKEMVS